MEPFVPMYTICLSIRLLVSIHRINFLLQDGRQRVFDPVVGKSKFENNKVHVNNRGKHGRILSGFETVNRQLNEQSIIPVALITDDTILNEITNKRSGQRQTTTAKKSKVTLYCMCNKPACDPMVQCGNNCLLYTSPSPRDS